MITVKPIPSYGKQGLPVVEIANGRGSVVRLGATRHQVARIKAWLRVERLESELKPTSK